MSTPRTPEVDVGIVLAAALGLVAGTDIMYGPPRSPTTPGVASASIWVHPFGGPPPEPYLAAAQSGSRYLANVQVWVLSTTPDDFSGGLARARQVRAALHTKAPTGYTSCLAQTSEPLYLARNEAGQHRWTMNFTLRWQAVE